MSVNYQGFSAGLNELYQWTRDVKSHRLQCTQENEDVRILCKPATERKRLGVVKTGMTLTNVIEGLGRFLKIYKDFFIKANPKHVKVLTAIDVTFGSNEEIARRVESVRGNWAASNETPFQEELRSFYRSHSRKILSASTEKELLQLANKVYYSDLKLEEGDSLAAVIAEKFDSVSLQPEFLDLPYELLISVVSTLAGASISPRFVCERVLAWTDAHCEKFKVAPKNLFHSPVEGDKTLWQLLPISRLAPDDFIELFGGRFWIENDSLLASLAGIKKNHTPDKTQYDTILSGPLETLRLRTRREGLQIEWKIKEVGDLLKPNKVLLSSPFRAGKHIWSLRFATNNAAPLECRLCLRLERAPSEPIEAKMEFTIGKRGCNTEKAFTKTNESHGVVISEAELKEELDQKALVVRLDLKA